jgi:hypothetical protein
MLKLTVKEITMADKNTDKSNQNSSAPNIASPVKDSPEHVTAGDMPADWPGAFGIYKYSRAAVGKVIVTLIVIYLINFAVGILLSGFIKNSEARNGLANVIGLITVLPYALTYLAGVRGKTLDVGAAFNQPLQHYLKVIAVQIIVGLIALVSFLALIVPFFFVFPRVILATYFQADNPDMDILDSIRASWDKTNGHVGKVYGIVGVNILMALLVITIIGIPVAIYLLVAYSAAFAYLYRYIVRK